MSPTRSVLAAALAALLCAAAPAWAGAAGRRGAAPRRAAPPPTAAVEAHVEELPDGVELIVLPVPRATTAALWVVVRAGSAWDPPDRAGLAHLIEHAILEGPGGAALFDDVRAAAGQFNGLTYRDSTRYLLGAPAARFVDLAPRFLRLLTNPAFTPAAMDAAFGVVSAEAAFRGGTPSDLVEDALFASEAPPGAASGGARASRADMLTFYGRHYATRNLTVIVAGDLTPAAARELVAPAILLPPALPGERTLPRSSTPILPLNERVRSAMTATVFGYRLDDEDRAACAALADLASLRLELALRVRDPAASAVDAQCEDLRGAPYLLAFGFTRAASEGDLPARIEHLVQGLASAPPSERERRAIAQRAERAAELLAGDPEALAAAAAALAARPRLTGGTPVAELTARPPAPGALAAVARRTFVRERALRLVFTPFQE